MKWYLKVLKQYFDFKGRARRKEYWMFTLFNAIFIFALAIMSGDMENPSDRSPMFYVFMLYYLGILIPSLAVSVRRLHDIGKSGWMIFISLIPLIGSIWLLVLYCTDGESGTNKWGTNPKMVTDEIGDIGRE